MDQGDKSKEKFNKGGRVHIEEEIVGAKPPWKALVIHPCPDLLSLLK